MLDIAVIGAGAVAEEGYLPAITHIPEARLTSIVDVNASRARQLSQTFGSEQYSTDIEPVLSQVDLVVIATPPKFHDTIAEQCITNGVHVLVEKPVATSSARAAELVSLADQHDVHFGISRQQREAPGARILHSYVNNGSLGEIQSVTGTYGDPTNWQFASDYRLRKSLAWGGVLTDKAPHLLDVLLWVFGTKATVQSYRDDSFGGLEANLEVELTFADTIDCLLEITASRDLTNEVCVRGTQGELVTNPGGSTATLHDRRTGERTLITVTEGSELKHYLARIGKQLERFVDAVNGSEPTYVPASTGVRIVELIEACYEIRELHAGPWELISIDDYPKVG